MNVLLLIGVLLVAVITFIARTVICAEYDWWGPRVAERLVRGAANIAPREGSYEEWVAELGAFQASGTGDILFSLQIVIASLRLRGAHIRRKYRRRGWITYFLLTAPEVMFSMLGLYFYLGIVHLARRDYASSAALFLAIAVCSPFVVWQRRRVMRGFDVQWVRVCLKADLTRDQMDACLWTHGEHSAFAAYTQAMNDRQSGIPWANAQRPILLYRYGPRLGAWAFARRVRRAEQENSTAVSRG